MSIYRDIKSYEIPTPNVAHFVSWMEIEKGRFPVGMFIPPGFIQRLKEHNIPLPHEAGINCELVVDDELHEDDNPTAYFVKWHWEEHKHYRPRVNAIKRQRREAENNTHPLNDRFDAIVREHVNTQ